MVDRTRKEFSDEEIARIAGTYHAWRGEPGQNAYEDLPGFCRTATLAEIGEHNQVLTPGRYVGAATVEADSVPFEKRFAELKESLNEQFSQSEELSALIQAKLEKIGTHA